MKEEFLKIYPDYPNYLNISTVEFCSVSENDIPQGSGGINREKYTYKQLRHQPIISELMENIENSRIKKLAEECNSRNSSQGFSMYKVDGEYCFWGLRLSPVVKTPTEEDLRSLLKKDSSTNEALANKAVTPRMIRDITYMILRNEVANLCGISVKEASHAIGNLLDCAPHEDASGYIFMVPNWAHSWFRHDGYVSKMINNLNR